MFSFEENSSIIFERDLGVFSFSVLIICTEESLGLFLNYF
jgi:hypothetical protein